MLSDARVAPTLAVTDLRRAREFYEDTLGLEVEAEVAETVRYKCGGGTGLAIFERPMTPVDRTVAAFEVEDIEAEVAELRSRGVEMEDIVTLPGGVRRARVFQRSRRQHHRDETAELAALDLVAKLDHAVAERPRAGQLQRLRQSPLE